MNQTAINFDIPRQPAHDPELLTLLDVVECKPGLFRPDFADWLRDNWHIWLAFEHQANLVWARGRRHYSGRTIIEVLRHESGLRERDGAWKISDWWTPDLCRLYMLMRPEREGFFELRGRH